MTIFAMFVVIILLTWLVWRSNIIWYLIYRTVDHVS